DGRARPPAASPAAPAAAGVPVEISVHIERVGDRRVPGRGWIGTRGERLRLEAFGLTPLGEIAPADLEYMAFGPAGRQTPWASEGRLVGSRGRALPLTGIAVRLNPALAGSFEAVYRGAFFSGAVVGPCRDGEPCLSPNADDPLEAIEIAIRERG
ncbi:MAG TPA: glycosyl transferase, partial [Stellaceae bacterium]|nr:glycosyl transferase [Stellaceae bacterium]